MALTWLSGCQAMGASDPEDVAPLPSLQLLGQIKPERTTCAVGEDLFVDYVLRYTGAIAKTFKIEDKAEDPDQPFHGYSFNAARAGNKMIALKLQFLGPPLTGRQTFAPGGSKRFQRIRWRATQPGTYELTFSLEWLEGELVQFEPVLITVTGVGGETAPIDPALAAKADALVAELRQLHAVEEPDDANRTRRAEVRRELIALGEGAAPRLVAALDASADEADAGDAAVKTAIVRALIGIGMPALDAVITGLGEGGEARRTRCAFILGAMRGDLGGPVRAGFDSRVVPVLESAARSDPATGVREIACSALAEAFEPAQSVPVLLDGLADRDVAVRRTCDRSLRRVVFGNARHEGVGFDPAGPAARRARAIQAWRKAWKDRQDGAGGGDGGASGDSGEDG